MKRRTCVCISVLVCVSAISGKAQSSAPAPPPNAGPTAILVPDVGVRGLSLSGLLDGYYSLNFNHPGSGINQLRNFDVRADQFGFNMGKLTAEYARGPFATRFDVGAGRIFDIMHGSDTAPRFLRHFEQAFGSFTPPRARGFRLDFGKFVTSAGAEVIETNENWNYSRSLLFALALPYYHFGLRTSMPLTKHFSAGLQVVNGWNNVEDNNSGKTIGFTGSVTVDRITWTHNYYFGPEKDNTNEGYRHLYDTTLLVAANRLISFYLNFDYGLERRLEGGSDHWAGVGGAARFILTPKIALTPRVEWFNDANGFSTGTAQRLKEVTLTGEYMFMPGVVGRLEYRRDWSNVPFFQRGNVPDAAKSQTTLLGGLMLSFAQRR